MKKDEKTIKEELLKRLSEISEKKSDELSLVTANGGGKVEITTKYDPGEFGFASGQFIKIEVGGNLCGGGGEEKIGLCVGVGKGCPNDAEEDNLWFLLEGRIGISHFCGDRAEDFENCGAFLLE